MISCSVDWSQPDAFEQWQAKCAATQARHVANGTDPTEEAIAAIRAATVPVVIDSYERRQARMIAVEAERIAANPMVLDDIPALAAWSKPTAIIAVCESLLERSDRTVSEVRLRGAIEYARRIIINDAEAA